MGCNFYTLNLATDFYREAMILEIKSNVVKNQFERAALSVVLTLAEGAGRLTRKDKIRFYNITLGSLRECQVIIKLMNLKELEAKSNYLAACLCKLIKNPGGI